MKVPVRIFAALLLLVSFSLVSTSLFAQCKLLNETFTNPITLSATNTNGAWYPDRYQPAGFQSAAGSLKISISPADGAQLRPSGFQSAFYNTQGRKYNQCGKCVSLLKADIIIPTNWATNHRRSDIWASALDAANASSFFPIIGFANLDGVSPSLRYWNGSAFVNVATPITYNVAMSLEASLVGGNVVYKINGATVGTVPSNGSVYYDNIIINTYNFNDNTLPAAQQDLNPVTNTYDAFWDNVSTSAANGNLVTNTITGETFCSIQAAIDAPLTLNTHTISVGAGTYNEQVLITKSVNIIGANSGTAGNATRVAESIVDGENASHACFVVNANNVTINGFTIKSGGGASYGCGVFSAVTNSGLSLINNIITDNVIGAYPQGNGASSIKRNLFDGNNRPGAAGGAGIYAENTNGLTIEENEFKNHTINSAVIFAATTAMAHQGLVFTKNNLHDNNASNSMVYCVGVNGALFSENTITQPATRAIKFAGACTGMVVKNNLLNDNGVGVKIENDFPALGANSNINIHFNSLQNCTTAGIENVDAIAINATCNWFGNISGPTSATNMGGTGANFTGVGLYKNWLNYGTDANPALVGFQLPTAVTVTAGGNTTAAMNHYRLLSNAIGCVVDNQTLTLAGTFNFSNPTALTQWALGNDGLNATDDDYSVKAPDNVNNVTLTATSLGNAIIRASGDIPTANLEGFLYFNGDGNHKNWNINKLDIQDFDLGIGMFFGSAGVNAFDDTKIRNNKIRIPSDLNATVAPADVNQNIGIHFSFGLNQTISANEFNVEGDGISNGANLSSTVVMQSNTSGGTAYDGLVIKGNTINIISPQSINPSRILGIWENGHNQNADIEISENIFKNTAGNNPQLNLQRAFRVTSKSGPTKNVEYKNNEVFGANVGMEWISGYTFPAGAKPVLVNKNIFDKTDTAILVRTDGTASINSIIDKNSFTNTGKFAIKNEATTGTDTAVATCNWFGTTAFATLPSLLNGNVKSTTILNNGNDGSASTGFQPTGNCVLLPVHNVTKDLYYYTIQSAINATATTSGDSLYVAAGTYIENILVNKNLKISGPNANTSGCSPRVAEAILLPATLDFDYTTFGSTNQYSIVRVEANSVAIKGFTLNGDNPAITGGNNANGANIDKAEGITIEMALNSIDIQNNIFKNIAQVGVDVFQPNNSPGTGNSFINNNKFSNIDNSLAGSYGIGVLLYNNFYAQTNNNCMDTVGIGVQTGNYYMVNPGAATPSISNNNIKSRIIGVWHNLAYQSASNFTINNNNLTKSFNATANTGLFISSLFDGVGASVIGNVISNTKFGIELWNNPTTNPITITNGSITNCDTAVFANNYDSYADPMNLANGTSTYNLSGVAITGSITGIHVKDNILNTNTAPVVVNITNNTTISSSSNGLLLTGARASASFGAGTPPAAFTGQTVYINQLTNGSTVPATNIDATAVSFDGQTGLTATLSQNFAIENKINHKIDVPALGYVSVKALNNFVTTQSFIAHATTAASVQRGIDVATTGFVVNVANGTYNGNVNVNKAMITLLGQSTAAIIRGTNAGPQSMNINANNVTVRRLTITRDFGTTLTDWYATGNVGGLYAENVSDLVIDSIVITGNRNGILFNGNTNFSLTNSNIFANRTGLQIFGVLTNGQIRNNFITNNFTHGIVFNFDQLPTSASNLNVNENDISGNWYSQISFQRNPMTPMSNVGSFATANFNCNWYGITPPVYDATATTEPGYEMQVPAQFGGADPNISADIKGIEAALISYQPYLLNGTDNDLLLMGFQPVANSCGRVTKLYVNDNVTTSDIYTTAVGIDATNNGTPAAPFRTINKALLVAANGDTIYVDGGIYPENVVVTKKVNIIGRQAGTNVNTRFATFTAMPISNPKANTTLESVITAPVDNPFAGNPNANDLVRVLVDSIRVNGFTLDGNNPAIVTTPLLVDDNNLAIHARRGITNLNNANLDAPFKDVTITHNIFQNIASRCISLGNDATASTGNRIDSNYFRNYGADVNAGGWAVLLLRNAYANVKGNTVIVPHDNNGIQLQNFFQNGSMKWDRNNITVGKDAIGLTANLFYAPAAILNMDTNTINAATGIMAGTDYTWGIYTLSVQVGSTVNLTGNNIGATGGQFDRGVNLWNLPTTNTVSVRNGSISNAAVGVAMDNVDVYFGAGATSQANVRDLSITSVGTQIGVRARTSILSSPFIGMNVAPAGNSILRLNNVSINAAPTAIGVQSFSPTTAGAFGSEVRFVNTASTIVGGTQIPIQVNGDNAQVEAGNVNITLPSTGAFNAIQFSNITAASNPNLVLNGGLVVNLNGNAMARAFQSPAGSIVRVNNAWTATNPIIGGPNPVRIDGSLWFNNGNLSSGTGAIEFGTTATDFMVGANKENNNSYLLGKALMLTRAVGNGALDMLGVSLAAEAGSTANLGNFSIERTTGAGLTPAFAGNAAINTRWLFTPQNITAARGNVRFRYLDGLLNTQTPSSIFAYRFNNSAWTKVSATLNSTTSGDVYTTSQFAIPNFSPWTLSSTPGLTNLYVKVLLQGAYAGGAGGLMRDDLRTAGLIPTSQPYNAMLSSRFTQVGGGGSETTTNMVLAANAGTGDAIVDWVMVEFRSSTNSSTVLRTVNALLQRDGDIVGADGNVLSVILPNGNYYVSVKHRNHLGVMTATAALTAGTDATINFTTGANTFGTNAQVQLATGVFGMIGGDANANGSVSFTDANNDRTVILNTLGGLVSATIFTYNSSDVDMNGRTFYTDAGNDRTWLLSFPLMGNITITLFEQIP